MNLLLTSHIILLLARPPCHSIWCTVPIFLEGSSEKQVITVKRFILKAYLLFPSSFWIWTSQYLSFCVCLTSFCCHASEITSFCSVTPGNRVFQAAAGEEPVCHSIDDHKISKHSWEPTWCKQFPTQKEVTWRDCALHLASSPSSRLQRARKDHVRSQKYGWMLLTTGGHGCSLGRTGRGKERNMRRLHWGSITNPLTKRRK